MGQIMQLPPSVVNKIAAGEVIERPASVVKELLENAVDAGASRMDVAVKQGGADLVRVSDDGCGIAADELALAVTSHATSKIRSADDLFHVGTLGFRGEALASIAEISHFQLRSRTGDATAGAQLEVRGGAIGAVEPCGCRVGTTIDVRNLFFSTPVRRKFMRTTQTEMGHISEAFIRVALAHEKIHFSLHHNDRPLFDLPATDEWRGRIATFFGQEIAEALMWVQADEGPVRLSGYVANPNLSRSNNRMQYLFLNGRYIRDRSLSHALGEAYRGLLMTGRYAIAFLRIDLAAEDVDVNVHPTKLEVRFQDGGQVYSQMLGTLRNRFLSTDLTARVQPVGAPTSDDHPAAAIDANHAARQASDIVNWARGQESAATPSGHGAADNGPQGNRQQQKPLAWELPSRDSPFSQRSWGNGPEAGTSSMGSVPRTPTPSSPLPASISPAPAASATSLETASAAPAAALQVHDRYLVAESDEGVVVIDQHALHERILYEELREKVLRGALETQQLLVPEPVQMTAAESATILDARELLGQLGIEVAPFGGDTVLVSSYPAMLANLCPEDLLRQLVERLMASDSPPDRRDVLDDLLHSISCKAAIKAGDRLTREEISALMDRRQLVQDSHHCPHGRPTALVFTREELDRRFKRI